LKLAMTSGKNDELRVQIKMLAITIL